MMQFLLVLIFISGALSLLSYIFCWQDIAAGRPHIISLRQITSIMDRKRLNAHFGAPKRGFYYQLTPVQVEGILWRQRGYMIAECSLDGLCVLGSWWFASGLGSQELELPFIGAAGLSQLLNVLYSFFLLRKWQHQMQEELENSDD